MLEKFLRKVIRYLIIAILIAIISIYIEYCISHPKSLVVSLNGEKVEITSNDYIKLSRENDDLRTQIDELEQMYESVSSEYQIVKSKNSEYLREINNLQYELESYASQFIPEQEVSMADTVVDLEYFADICTPYEYPDTDFYDIRTVTCHGIEYKDKIYLNSAGESGRTVMYNLDGQYITLEVTLGRVDNSGMDGCEIHFYDDGVYTGSIKMKANGGNVTSTIYLHECSVLEMIYSTGNTGYAFLNAELK